MPQDQKKLPWFKFTPNEWLTGNIVGEDMCAQGVFINICAYYWKEGGSVPLSKIERRYGKYDSFNLIKKEYLKINDNIVNIKFLDEQLSGLEESSSSASKSANSKWNNENGPLNNKKRHERLSDARKVASHTKDEWNEMVDYFQECVKCGNTNKIVKDHIIPIYQGGSDGIENLQPLCSKCNSSKGPDTTDHRTNWCLRNACEMPAKWLPTPTDKDIDKEKEKEEVYTSASPFFEKSGKKLKLDPKVAKAVKKLNDSKDISLIEVEERFFPGQGTQSVIEAFQTHFASIGYGYKSDQGVKTVFLSWEGQLRHEKTKTDFDKNIVPVVKMTESGEEEFAKFMQYKPKVTFLCNFLWQEPLEDRTAYMKSLISKYGLEGTIRKIAEYHYNPIGGQTKQTWRNFQMISEIASMTNEEWNEVKEAHEIKL